MSQFQSGILLEHRRFAIWLEARATGDLAALRQGCHAFLQQLAALQQQFPDAGLGAVIAFGDALWRDLQGTDSAPELKAFTPLGKGAAPATQRDLLIHIQSLRHDVNFSLAQAALTAFAGAVAIEEETHGFRWVEDRDLSGFVDGTENPQGEARQQEAIIGRTKQDNEELPGDQRPATSHLSRVDLKEAGKGLKILRQSLPYGTASGRHGLYFISYCHRLYNIEQQLLSMFGERDGKMDAMLRFTKPVSGSYFFAPSLTALQALSR